MTNDTGNHGATLAINRLTQPTILQIVFMGERSNSGRAENGQGANTLFITLLPITYLLWPREGHTILYT